jgi:hypothetical protein
LLTARFNLVGRPPSFIYGFNGFKTSFTQLAENIEVWIEDRRQKDLNLEMKSFPAIIATQGVFGCRNAAPLSARRNHLFGIGVDDAPIRLIVLHLLYALNRRLKITSDGSGLRPGLDAYLMKMAPPNIQYTTGRATHAVIRTAAITEKVVDDSADEGSSDEKSVEAVVESIPTAAVVEKEVVDSIVEDEPVAKQSPNVESVEAVFETVPTATATTADAGPEIEATPAAPTGENKSFDPFAELEVDSSGIEAEFVEMVTEDDFVDPLIDSELVEAAAEAATGEQVLEQEETPDPFAEMELVDPGSEEVSAKGDAKQESPEAVEMTTDEFDVEEDFVKTVVIPPPNAESDSKNKKPAFEQDFISTPAAPHTQNSN